MSIPRCLLCLPLIVSASWGQDAGLPAFESGTTVKCVLDSQYLAASGEKGFQFEAPDKKGVLDLGLLFSEGSGATFRTAAYRRGFLNDLGLAVSPMTAASGLAILQDGEGDDAGWEIRCYKLETAELLGIQWAGKSALDSRELFGIGDKPGWPLLGKASQSAWIFLPASQAGNRPGETEGLVISGQLQIGDAKEIGVKLPGSGEILPCKRIKIRFRPKSGQEWKCGEEGCAPREGSASVDDLERAYAKTGYVYWHPRYGILAEANRMNGPNASRWSWRWFSRP